MFGSEQSDSWVMRCRGVVVALALVLPAAACSASADAPAEADAEAVAAAPGTQPAEATMPEPDPVPQLSDFPDENSTGVPPGTVLEESDSLTIEEEGAVIDGLDVTGTVTVKADDVVIRNTRIKNTGHIPIRLMDAENLLVEDSEIDGQGRGNPAVAFSKYTLRRVHIHDVAEGPRIAGGNVTIEDSYIHSMVQEGDNHTDVIQVMGGSNIVIRGNNLQAYNPETGLLGNAAFMFGEDSSEVRDCLVEGNLMSGGNYTVNGGGSGTKGAACSFSGNAFQREFRYGVRANLGPNVEWDDSNAWLGTATPVAGTD